MSRILATSYHPGGILAIKPVIKRLKEKGEEVFVVAYKNQDFFKKQGIEYFPLRDDSVSSLQEVNQGAQLVLTGQSTPLEGDSTVIEHSALRVGRQNGIPVISVSDFWTNRRNFFRDSNSSEDLLLPDKITVIDPWQKQRMIREGFPSEKLFITGNPHFDSLKKRHDPKKIKRRLGLDWPFLVLYVTNTGLEEKDIFGDDLKNLEIIYNTFCSLDKKEKIGLLIKLHPLSSPEHSRQIRKYLSESLPQNSRVDFDISPLEAISLSDLVLTSFSTIGIEALFLEKPVISLQPDLKGEDFYAFVTAPYFVPVGRDPSSCQRLIHNAVSSEANRKNMLRKTREFRWTNNATGNVCDLIYKTLDSSTSSLV